MGRTVIVVNCARGEAAALLFPAATLLLLRKLREVLLVKESDYSLLMEIVWLQDDVGARPAEVSESWD